MMVKRIRWHILPRANSRQYGFIPQKCTEDALYDMLTHIVNNMRKKFINIIVSLDIEGAFDSAWWPAIKCRLRERKCPRNLRRLMNSYLEDRKVRVRYANKEYIKVTNKGCIQGSSGGPTFWNILLNPLLDELERRGIYCQAFADDIVLVFSGESVTELERQADQTLAYVEAWGIKNKLKFAAHKTSAMVVTKKLKFETPRIHMGEVEIQMVDQIKMLVLVSK
ncbi:unnamed protein product [Parnassius mnemosyne]|uniref:Reverse transcriptase domain-containing protein n=1 Tax=Parnassius mnemosyne TaxID=213953 RepID=A0AAV1LDK8_9NEOP